MADALGVPVEFKSRQELKSNPVKDMTGYGTHPVPAGTWSDDTSMAIATLDSLTAGIDYDDIMSKFCAWKTKAAYTAIDEVFDMGVSTNTAFVA
ncbi:ADP-ribosylglycohydrolase family protein [Bariatricus sp. HCP28S3_B10]|uniref:ADP-ribosylglycohydrolase family protein n=1 Tax=unclassified Bariatricus TaxID=2677046 RepID=UPI003F898CAA